MISHVHIGVADFERALAFYAAVLPELGLALKFCERDKPWAGWMLPGQPRPLLLIGAPFNGDPASAGNGQMIALLAPTRQAVQRAYDAAIKHGARCDGAPGLRPEYHADYFGAYFRDRDGNKLCICCHQPVLALEDSEPAA